MQGRRVLTVLVAALALLTYGVTADALDASPDEGSSHGTPGREGDYQYPDVSIDDPGDDTTGTRTDLAVSRYVPRLSPAVLAVLAVLVALAIGITWLGAGRGDEVSDTTAATGSSVDRSWTPGEERTSPADVAYDVDPTNEVYRAWLEMVDRLDIDRTDATTPGEYARRARRLDVDTDAVDRLTALFERVRYGGADPEPLADEARTALAAIPGETGQNRTETTTESRAETDTEGT